MIPRSQALSRITAEEFDVLVIGGGVTGAGVALDAASRGYSVCLIEQTDFAAGTSSRSSKLIHGGLRYLQNFDLGLVREALLERQLNVSLAPHLVTPLKMIVPAFGGARLSRTIGVGLNMYDVMAVDRFRAPSWWRQRRGGTTEPVFPPEWSPERHRTISGDEVTDLVPALARKEPTSGYLFYDCQTDDVRLVLTILGEAQRFGTVIANRIKATSLLEENGYAVGAAVVDTESGQEFPIRAANIVNATGVWADKLRPSELHDEAELPTMRPSRGTHILISTEKLKVEAGVIVSVGGRSIFVLPWLGRVLVGTTDNDYEGELEHIPPSYEDVEYLLDSVNGFFGTSLTDADIEGAFGGVRPLVAAGDSKKSVDISRRAELYETSSGMITITGGKLTTWRRMAKHVVDRMVERDGRGVKCQTQSIPLGMPVDPSELKRPKGIAEESADDALRHLASRYGHAAHSVLALVDANKRLGEPIVAGFPDLMAEVAWSIQKEQARTIEDVLLRRTRLGLLAARQVCDPKSSVVDRVGKLMARELKWNSRTLKAEKKRFFEAAEAEGLVVQTNRATQPVLG